MRVAVVISSLKRGGGAEKVAALIAAALPDKSTEAHLITFYDDDSEYPYDGARTCFAEHTDQSAAIKIIQRAHKIAALCRTEKIDVVISFMEEANFPVLLSKWFGNKAAAIVSVRQDPLVYGLVYQTLMRWLYPRAKWVVAVSLRMQSDLEKKFGLKNVTTIYNPYDASKVAEQAKAEVPAAFRETFKKKFTFITIGRLSFQKGQWFLVRAFKEVVTKHPDARLLVVGEGELRADLEALTASLGLTDVVHFIGNQTNVYPFLKASDCFVLPSLWEGFPNTMVEALAMDLPVISTDCPTGPREILAPGVPIQESLAYPYEAKYGILIGSFPRTKLADMPADLLPEERLLAKQLNRMIADTACRAKYSHGSARLESLQINTIIHEWKKLLPEPRS